MKLVKLSGIWKKIVPSYTVIGSEISGVIQAFAGTVDKIPENWLLCDGAEYSVADYPDLYSTIGNTYGGTEGSTFKVPDCRECVPVGVGRNTTNSMGAHDEYTIGQFKDDQLQQMTGGPHYDNNTRASWATRKWSPSGPYTVYGSLSNSFGTSSHAISSANCPANIGFNSARQARSGTTTHGKQKGVNYIIHI